MLKHWFISHKVSLLIFTVTTLILVIVTSIQIFVLLKYLDDFNLFIEQEIITTGMYMYGIITLVNIAIFAIWVIILLYLFLRVIFPSKKAFKNAFFINELEFLAKMPSSLRKELRKK